MRSVPALDSTALNALKGLVQVCKSKGITIVFSHVNDQPMKVMKKAGFIELVGKVNFQPSISAALDVLKKLFINKKTRLRFFNLFQIISSYRIQTHYH